MSEEYKRIFESRLWEIANSLPGRMNSQQLKNYILGLIFFKLLTEKLRKSTNKILEPDIIIYSNLMKDSG